MKAINAMPIKPSARTIPPIKLGPSKCLPLVGGTVIGAVAVVESFGRAVVGATDVVDFEVVDTVVELVIGILVEVVVGVVSVPFEGGVVIFP